jgi:hypothetical protein
MATTRAEHNRTIAFGLPLNGIAVALMLLASAPAIAQTVVLEGLTAEGTNLLKPDAWGPYGKGFVREGDVFVCDNAADADVQRGAAQSVVLNQDRPRPIVAALESRSEGVGGEAGPDYSLYLDLEYADGTPLWGQVGAFRTGTHDWQPARVTIFPAKPVRRLTFYAILRRHAGKAWFRGARLVEVTAPAGAAMFDGTAVRVRRPLVEGFLVRDLAAGDDFVAFDDSRAAGLVLTVDRQEGAVRARDVSRGSQQAGADSRTPGTNVPGQETRHAGEGGPHTRLVATLKDATGRDRAVTLVYVIPFAADGAAWHADPRRSVSVQAPYEYVEAFRAGGVGAAGMLSHYPLAAVSRAGRGRAVCLDMARPAFFRVGYSAGAGALYIAWDLALAKEKPAADVGCAAFEFDAAWGFRAAVERMMQVFPEAFVLRVKEQGLWMPFFATSKVKGWEDFGFKFKEGHDETAWDDAHGILTFRYTEPMTWWMTMPKGLPRTCEAALAHAQSLAEKGNPQARALMTSGHRDADGRLVARLRDEPWCDGAVWSMNSAPGLAGDVTDFGLKWNGEVRARLYGPGRKGDLDGEYVDSSEGYVTDVLDFDRAHFAGMDTPLVFDSATLRPAVFRGLIAFEYVRGIERDVRALGKLMMANGAPTRLPWLCPMLDVLGTETDWNPGGRWRPMSDSDLLYRRVMCGPKPFCFLMNSDFDRFGADLTEKYMRRCLAYGMFPGFFSADASTGHYFSRDDLYGRDRPLFKRYMPLIRRVAEAGWRPVTGVRSSDEKAYVERWGERLLTVFNDSPERRTAVLTLDGMPAPARCRDILRGTDVPFAGGRASVTLDAEDVAVLELE